MPYKSDAQRRWAHTKAGTKALGGPEKVKEWDKASKGKDLPMRKGYEGGGPVTKGDPGVPDFKMMQTQPPYTKGIGLMPASYAKGGPVLQTGRSIFMKTPDTFRTSAQRQDYGGAHDPRAKAKGDSKSLKPIKPRGG